MSLDNQSTYWDKVAETKTFTHPLDISLLENYLDKKSNILDYGCGYGRVVKQLQDAGFKNTIGFDTSAKLIERGKKHVSSIFHIDDAILLPVEDNSTDCIILFAVLTCIPSNSGQTQLVKMLRDKLKNGGFLYISDYYLQENSVEVKKYQYLNNDKNNYGVFSLPEGVIFRHHKQEYINTLLEGFEVVQTQIIEVKTMNGNSAEAFQILLRK